MKRYQLRYRYPKVVMDYSTPYTDLPEFESDRAFAFDLLAKIQADFPLAEWTLIEVVNGPKQLGG